MQNPNMTDQIAGGGKWQTWKMTDHRELDVGSTMRKLYCKTSWKERPQRCKSASSGCSGSVGLFVESVSPTASGSEDQRRIETFLTKHASSRAWQSLNTISFARRCEWRLTTPHRLWGHPVLRQPHRRRQPQGAVLVPQVSRRRIAAMCAWSLHTPASR